jgi:hypothetical protein
MRIRTLLLYLIGNRQAILEVASDRRYLGIGFLFVLSAAFAREYDGEDLLHEPWHLLLPFAASVLASALLFVMVNAYLGLREEPPANYPLSYPSFLRLFWMTAPLAWLYSIPVERWMTPMDATRANLCFLGIVSVWRVALMIRVLSVLLEGGRWAATFLVLLFSSGVVVGLSVAAFLPKITASMSGVRPSDAELLVSDTTGYVACVALCSLPVWFLGLTLTIKRQSSPWLIPLMPTPGRAASSWIVLVIGMVSVLFWLPALLVTQPEQRLKRQVEGLFREKHIAEALAQMSAHTIEDFPPHWEPPPKLSRYVLPSLLDVLEEMTTNLYAPWVRARYMTKLGNCLNNPAEYRWLDPEGRDLLLRISTSLERLRATQHESDASALIERIERLPKNGSE